MTPFPYEVQTSNTDPEEWFYVNAFTFYQDAEKTALNYRDHFSVRIWNRETSCVEARWEPRIALEET